MLFFVIFSWIQSPIFLSIFGIIWVGHESKTLRHSGPSCRNRCNAAMVLLPICYHHSRKLAHAVFFIIFFFQCFITLITFYFFNCHFVNIFFIVFAGFNLVLLILISKWTTFISFSHMVFCKMLVNCQCSFTCQITNFRVQIFVLSVNVFS